MILLWELRSRTCASIGSLLRARKKGECDSLQEYMSLPQIIICSGISKTIFVWQLMLLYPKCLDQVMFCIAFAVHSVNISIIYFTVLLKWVVISQIWFQYFYLSLSNIFLVDVHNVHCMKCMNGMVIWNLHVPMFITFFINFS